MLLDRLDHLGDADLDAQVDDLVAVVGEDDVDQVLADVVNVPLHRGQHDGAAPALVRALHVRLEVGDRLLHGLGRAEHEGQLHLAGGEELANGLHAIEQQVIDDGQWCQSGRHRRVEIVFQAGPVPVDDPSDQALLDAQILEIVGALAGDGDPFEERQELGQRVIALVSPVVDEIEAHLARSIVDLGEGQDLRRMDDGSVEACCHALVQEDAVEHLASSWA